MKNFMAIPSDEIENYLNIYINGGGDYHPYKNKIAYISDQTGVYQVYTKDLNTGEITQISNGENRSTNPIYLADGSLTYSTDFGGNERFQIMIYNEEGQEIHHYRLTSFLEAKHQFRFATDNAIYISANLMDNQRFDVFRYKFPLKEGMKEELLMEGEPFIPLSPVIVNESENKLLISKIKGNLSNDLILLNLETSDINDITHTVFGEHNYRFYPIEFLTDDLILLRSDYQRDFVSLALFDINLNEIKFLESSNWNTQRAIISSKENHSDIIFSKNIEGSSKLYHGNLVGSELIEIKELQMPNDFGVLSSGDFRSFTRSFVFNPEKTKLLLTFSAPSEITNLYELHLEKNTVSQILDKIKFDGKKFLNYSLHKFKSFDELEVPYFLMTPEGEGPFSTIFVIHGGPESQSKAGFSNKLQLLASQGYMVVLPNIRGSNGYGRKYLALDDIEKRLDSIKDIKSLADHLVETNDKMDPHRLVIYGGSYGGFAVLSSITEFPERFNVAIDVVGISNFVTFLENTADWRRRLREVEYGFLDQHRELLEKISPSNKVDEIITPTLIIQGDNDERVPLSESIQMYEKLQRNNVPSKLLRFEDEGHGVVKRNNQIIQYQAIFEFLDKYL